MKVGLFFGSFNPVHTGHLIIASYMVEYTDLDRVWFVVSPQNPLKHKRDLLNEYDRLDLIRSAVDDDDRLQVSDVEFNLPRPSYTIHTLLHLEERHRDHQFVMIMGSDSLNSIHKWKNFETLLDNYEIYVYTRPENELKDYLDRGSIKVFEAPKMQISSTFVRKSIRKGKSVRYLVPEKVIALIEKWGYYGA